jgi:hypothetical protein
MDYTKLKSKEEKAINPNRKIVVNSKDTQNAEPQTAWWYESEDRAVLDAVKGMTALLENNLRSRIDRYRIESRLYGINDYFASVNRGYNNAWNTANTLSERLTFNAVQSNVDTLISKVSRLRPRARFLTNAGNFRAVKAAKKLGYFADGIFQENDVYSMARSVIRDALVFGDGFIHIFNDTNRVRLERVIPYEIFLDELECVGGGKPTHIYRIILVSRQALMDMFPDKREDIARSIQLFSVNLHITCPATDQIEVLEAWKLGTGEDRKNGRHLLAVPDCVLSYGEYTDKEFPFARISWTQPFNGYFSQSLAEQLKSTQLEINKLLAVQQRSYHLAGSFKILVQNGSQIPTESFNNNIGTIIKYTGNKPEYITPHILPPEFYRNLETLIERSYKISGVSSLSAFSQKPAGLDSGVALREFNDIESARFLEFSQDIEAFFVDVAKCSMSLARQIALENGGHYPVNMPGPKSLTKIDLKEIKLREDDYTISVFPASSLPTEPSGRLAAIDDLAKRGLIDPTETRELLNFPDVEASNQLSTAQEEYLKEIFEKMLEDNEYTAPDPMDNLQLAQKMALQFYALGKKLGEDEDKLELIRQYMRDLMTLQNPPPAPIIPNLPQPELGSMMSQAEAEQLSLPAAAGPLPGAEALVQGAAAQAGALPPI